MHHLHVGVSLKDLSFCHSTLSMQTRVNIRLVPCVSSINADTRCRALSQCTSPLPLFNCACALGFQCWCSPSPTVAHREMPKPWQLMQPLQRLTTRRQPDAANAPTVHISTATCTTGSNGGQAQLLQPPFSAKDSLETAVPDTAHELAVGNHQKAVMSASNCKRSFACPKRAIIIL